MVCMGCGAVWIFSVCVWIWHAVWIVIGLDGLFYMGSLNIDFLPDADQHQKDE